MGFVEIIMPPPIRTLSSQESRLVLNLTEQARREIARSEVAQTLGISLASADQLIRSLRRKGWIERASWGRYLLIPPNQGPEALGDSNLLALASRIAEPYYIGYGTAAAHYGLTTQMRNVIWLVTPQRVRNRALQDAEVRIVSPVARKFFGFNAVDVFGYPVMLSDIEKTTIDCIDRPDLCGSIGEAALILAAASRRFDWHKVADYLDRIRSTSLVRRFGWLADRIDAQMPSEVRERLQKYLKSAPVPILGPKIAAPGAVGYDAVWRLAVNVSAEEFHGSAGLGKPRQIKKRK
jgi:predicted transcriptional regulator of viral defense system